MTCSEKIPHYINCMFYYFETMIYDELKNNKTSYYIDNRVDKMFEFEQWVKGLSDQEIMFNCDYDKDITAKDIRDGLDELVKNWIGNNCKGDWK